MQVVGNNDTVRSDARKLAATIWKNERIRALAENPLMLTTLLVVKRNVGELPTRRVKLYKAAIDVLIRTWNVEGYEPLDEEETLTQLSYVACAMMNDGQQRIGRRRLLELLKQARAELEAELQFAAISPSQFIKRIEYRSSLLMQTGHERIDEELQPVYEFRHLTFQEYLAARGLVEQQYPGRDEDRSLVELLEPHFEDERWREVIPLAAVLAGRKAEPLIQRLTTLCEGRKLERGFPTFRDVNDPRVVLLRQCLLDEVQVTPAPLRAALRQMARHGSEHDCKGSVVELRRGKFGDVFQDIAEAAYYGQEKGWDEFLSVVVHLSWEIAFRGHDVSMSHAIAEKLTSGLTIGDRIDKARACLVCGWLTCSVMITSTIPDPAPFRERFRTLRNALANLLDPNDPPLAMAASWALGFFGEHRLPDAPPEKDLLIALYRLWQVAESTTSSMYAARAFAEQPLLMRDTFESEVWGDSDAGIEQAATRDDSDEENARLLVAWYRRSPWTDSELAEKLGEVRESVSSSPRAREMLAKLGEPGRLVLEKWDAEKKSGKRTATAGGVRL